MKFPDRSVRAVITHIVHGGQFGLPSGYCMFSFRVERPAQEQAPHDEMSASPAALLQGRQ